MWTRFFKSVFWAHPVITALPKELAPLFFSSLGENMKAASFKVGSMWALIRFNSLQSIKSRWIPQERSATLLQPLAMLVTS